MTNKGYLNFIIAFVLSIGFYILGITYGQGDNSNLWWWFRVIWRLIWAVFLIWLIYTDKPRLPSILGIVAALLTCIVHYAIWGLPYF